MDWSPSVRTDRRTVLGAVGTALTATAGCVGSAERPERSAADWPQSGYDGGNTWYKPAGSPPVDGASVAWTADVTAHTDYFSGWGTRTGLSITGDRAYAVDGSVIDLQDGTVRRQADCLEEGIVGFARTDTYDDGVLVTRGTGGAPDREFDATPRGLHGYKPSVDPGIGSRCGDAIRWTAGAPRDFPQTAGVARIRDDTVYTAVQLSGDQSRAVVAVDADDGRPAWREPISHWVERLCVDGQWVYVHSGYSRTGDPGALSVISDGSLQRTVDTSPSNVLVAARDGTAYLKEHYRSDSGPSLTTLDAATGERTALLEPLSRITQRIDGTASGTLDVVVGPETVFLILTTESDVERACVALDRSDGSVQWVEQSRYVYRLTGTHRALYLNSETTNVAALDPETGEQLWAQSADVSSAWRPVVGDTRLFVPGDDRLVALEAP